MVKNKQTPKGQLAKQRDTLGFQSGMRERESEKKTKTYLVNQYIYTLLHFVQEGPQKHILYILSTWPTNYCVCKMSSSLLSNS